MSVNKINTSGRLAHVLVCVNQRRDSNLPCCADAGAEEVYQLLRAWIEDRGMLAKIWLTRTECLGWCTARGATVVINPGDHWYRAVTADDVPTLIERHLAPLAT